MREQRILLCFVIQRFYHAEYEVCVREKLRRAFIRTGYEVCVKILLRWGIFRTLRGCMWKFMNMGYVCRFVKQM